MQVAMELEDDLFFADLSKEIALLIMEEEEEDTFVTSPAESLQAFSGAIYPTNPLPQFAFFYGQSLKRESKGTGVFIPQATQPRRNNKNRKGRSNNSHAKFQKHSQNTSRMVVSQAPHKNSFKPKNNNIINNN
ncbi:hypothetical protein PIB30_035238 [Stylosanthes scabra]|uniref:Uncharacterized protein n=1 Tax=Stylosanthes scabra TaxID=79078 RepID=A0ABU6UEW0_9FABA|nr:hypothetical protein [Stylosanthes scabra]